MCHPFIWKEFCDWKRKHLIKKATPFLKFGHWWVLTTALSPKTFPIPAGSWVHATQWRRDRRWAGSDPPPDRRTLETWWFRAGRAPSHDYSAFGTQVHGSVWCYTKWLLHLFPNTAEKDGACTMWLAPGRHHHVPNHQPDLFEISHIQAGALLLLLNSVMWLRLKTYSKPLQFLAQTPLRL